MNNSLCSYSTRNDAFHPLFLGFTGWWFCYKITDRFQSELMGFISKYAIEEDLMIKVIVKIFLIIFLSLFNNSNLLLKSCDISNISKEIKRIVIEFDNGSLNKKRFNEIVNCNLVAVEVDNQYTGKTETKGPIIQQFSCKGLKITFIYKCAIDKERDFNPETLIISFDNENDGILVSDLVKEFGEWDFLSKKTKETYMSFKFKGVKRKEGKYYTRIRCQNIFGSREIMNCLVNYLRIEKETDKL